MRPLGSVATVRLVAGRDLRQRLRSRASRIGTVLIAVLAAGLALLPALVPSDREHWTLAVVGTAPAALERIAGEVAGEHSATLTVRREGGRDAAALVRRDDIDAALVDGRRVVVDAEAGGDLRRVVAAAAVRARLVAAVDDPATATAARHIDVRRVGAGADTAGETVVRFAGVLALFFAIATYGSWVLNSVLEEKSNRVVEIIVSTVAPRRLLAGKVIGNGLAGLLQLLAPAAAALVAGVAGGGLSELPASGAVTILATLGWFVLGFAFYAVGYAAAGALVSRQEDAQAAVTPMMTIVMTGYLLSVLLVNSDPGSTAAKLVSLLPPVTPFAMPVRIAAGEVGVWEAVLSVLLMLVATWLTIRVAGRVYVGGLLRTGARVPLKRALRTVPEV